MRHYIFLMIWMLLSVASTGYAQKTKKVHGEYIYHAPENVSIEQARQTALSRAQIQALGDEFGTVVAQHNATLMNNTNGSTHTDFTSLSSSDVKGEWLETIGEPKYEISYEQGMLVVKCSVTGKARAIVAKQNNYVAKILCNGIEDRNEGENFKSGDDLYLAYQSATKGYLAVYLIDDNKNAYCLLPYQSSKDGKVEVDANTRYVFFNQKTAQPLFNSSDVDEYTMTCDKASETNYIYIISSPNPFIKAIDNAVEGLPRELKYDDFQKWLSKNRTADKDMQVEIKTIVVKK
ncbi:MAG: DUF4384 domain-containing protein [Escherichia coli]|nr:DUF4384 domain-containing protein [Escherichia coli]